MSQSWGERRWTLPAGGVDWRVVPSAGPEARESQRNRVPEVFITSALERWLRTPTARTLHAMYEALGGGPSLGHSRPERDRYEQRLKQRLAEAFSHGELVAFEVERPTLVPAPWPETPSPTPEETPVEAPTWLVIELADDEGKPVPHARYVVTLPDGSTREGTLNKHGYARVDGVNPGQCQVSFPRLDGRSWR
ncbi:carboxypeptidase regulatory-like domain-containing protein [Pyxidicoccus xibeiensis]|uniref:carboxypeptidase regulatory-like domain-containing protein n=1 Tax=Pyxidicoccus xibeiensis TaxID=2906759 RepID=UPI0020A7BC33|nr:carboxypeptidase regulatory-like domain-containing protein [Pyxidicoccus xibeiensis]MCP3136400.1 carboxypeptidase regulatory-like domain-containing protein [Pyxidicoccus xibeiensis]